MNNVQKLREQQRQMKCNTLCKALKTLEPIRLQCGEHETMRKLAQASNLFDEYLEAEMVECEFNIPKSRYNFCVTQNYISVDYPYLNKYGDCRKEGRCKITKIDELIEFIKKNNERNKEMLKKYNFAKSEDD